MRVLCRKTVAGLLLLSCVSVCEAVDRHADWRSALPAVGERAAERSLSVEGVSDYPAAYSYLSMNINLEVEQANLRYYIDHGATGVMYQYADAEANEGAD